MTTLSEKFIADHAEYIEDADVIRGMDDKTFTALTEIMEFLGEGDLSIVNLEVSEKDADYYMGLVQSYREPGFHKTTEIGPFIATLMTNMQDVKGQSRFDFFIISYGDRNFTTGYWGY